MSFTLLQAHATAMILAWMIFASTGILFARYGRFVRFGNRRQLLGKAVWFQIHRFLLSLTPLCTLAGFFFILVRAGGGWVDRNTADIHRFVHSVLGGIIVCCAMVQVWLALYRCNPRSRYRFLFDWSHRLIGLLSFGLVIPTIFTIIVLMTRSRPNLIPVFSCWTAWMGVVVVVFEAIEYRQRKAVIPTAEVDDTRTEDGKRVQTNANTAADTEGGTNVRVISQRLNQIKLLLLFAHMTVSTVLSILFIVFLSI